MPDLDKVERKLLPEWRPTYKLVKGNQPLEEAGHAAIKAMAKILRESGGVSAFHKFARMVEKRDGGLLDDRRLASLVTKLEFASGLASNTDRLLARAVLRPGVTGPASALRGPADIRLAKQFLVNMLEHGLFSQQRDYLIGLRFSSRQESIEFEGRLLREIEPALHKMAEQLAKDPRAKHLRAPRSSARRRLSTRELLEQPI